MYRSERWPEDEAPPPPRSRSSSRRSSASLSRRSSLKKETEGSAPASASSTPKKTAKPQNLDFLVTGKQIVKRTDRANSLPSACPRRPPPDVSPRHRKLSEVAKRAVPAPHAPYVPPHSPDTPRRDTTLDEDMSLDLSQVSDFEDMNSKYGGGRPRFATSTPLPPPLGPGAPAGGAGRSASLHSRRVLSRRDQHSLEHSSLHASRDSANSRDIRDSRDSRDSSVFNNSTSTASPYRGTAELDYSSVSPEYSGQSSAELSPRTLPARASPPDLSLRSQDLQLSSCCVSTWAECSEAGEAGEGSAGAQGGEGSALDGEWCAFWANYNNSLPSAHLPHFYDRCPTPYRADTNLPVDWELPEGCRKPSPESNEALTHKILSQGVKLSARDTRDVIKCAQLLGAVLARALQRPADTSKKHSMTLPLKETTIPLPVKEEKRCDTATTQTDISLPNTKSAPRIFENILRQLSRSSIDVDKIENKDKSNVKTEAKSEVVRQLSRSSINVDKVVSKDKVDSKDKSDIKAEEKTESVRQLSQRSIDDDKVGRKDKSDVTAEAKSEDVNVKPAEENKIAKE